MVNVICLTCKNWETEKCGDCLYVNRTKRPVKPQDIEFRNYREIPITAKEYKKRTGENWPEEKLVYGKFVTSYCTEASLKREDWRLMNYREAVFVLPFLTINTALAVAWAPLMPSGWL